MPGSPLSPPSTMDQQLSDEISNQLMCRFPGKIVPQIICMAPLSAHHRRWIISCVRKYPTYSLKMICRLPGKIIPRIATDAATAAVLVVLHSVAAAVHLVVVVVLKRLNQIRHSAENEAFNIVLLDAVVQHQYL